MEMSQNKQNTCLYYIALFGHNTTNFEGVKGQLKDYHKLFLGSKGLSQYLQKKLRDFSKAN